MLSVCCCTFRVFHALFIFGKAVEKAIPEGKNHRVIILDIRTALARRVKNESKMEFWSRKEKRCNEGSSRRTAGRILKITKEKKTRIEKVVLSRCCSINAERVIQIVSQIGLTCLKVTKMQSEFLPKQFRTALRREKGTALDGAKSRSGRLEDSRTFRVTSAA